MLISMARKTRHTDIRVGKKEAADMVRELEVRSRMAGAETETGQVLAFVANELQERITAGWRTRGGLPMTYFKVDLGIKPGPSGQVAFDLQCG